MGIGVKGDRMDEFRFSGGEIMAVVMAAIAAMTLVLMIIRDMKASSKRESDDKAGTAVLATKIDALGSQMSGTKESVDKLYGKFDSIKDDVRGIDTRLTRVESDCKNHDVRISKLEDE